MVSWRTDPSFNISSTGELRSTIFNKNYGDVDPAHWHPDCGHDIYAGFCPCRNLLELLCRSRPDEKDKAASYSERLKDILSGVPVKI